MIAVTKNGTNRSSVGKIDDLLKGLLDYVLAIVVVVVASPLFLAIAIAVRLTSRGPVIYRRRVVGRGGQEFDAYKFRTMVADADEILKTNPELAIENRGGRKCVDDPRLTPFGRRLRRTSLNELPQLFNVLKGQMSIVGPRMVTPLELEGHEEWRDAIVRVKPGITGLWQVSGREDLPLEERIHLDRHYVDHRNIFMDIRILLRTIPAVLFGKGAY